MSSQTIIQQDNARLIALVDAFEAARAGWENAAETWDTDPTIEAHAEALTEAEREAREAAADLAAHVAAWVTGGYRLHRPKA